MNSASPQYLQATVSFKYSPRHGDLQDVAVELQRWIATLDPARVPGVVSEFALSLQVAEDATNGR